MKLRCAALLLATICVAFGCAQADNAKVVRDERLVLLVPFDDGLHGCEGAPNPFAAIGHAALVEDPARPGKVLELRGHRLPGSDKLRATHHRSAVIVDGVNMPEQSATVGLSVRFTGDDHWSDGRRSWLMTLVPSIPGIFASRKADATGLAVIKDENNNLVLGTYQFGDGSISPVFSKGHFLADPTRIVGKISTTRLRKDDWARVRFGWDRKASTAWLALDDKIVSGKVEFGSAENLALVVGSPPKINWVKQGGPTGRIDDLVVSRETLGANPLAAFEMPAVRPAMAVPGRNRVDAVHLKGDPAGETMESMVRTHLKMVMDVQQVGGWAFSCAWPSRLYFLSRGVVRPYTRHHFNACKAQNSAGIALRLLAGYLCLGDKEHLRAAEKTARTLIAIQHEDGGFPNWAEWDPQAERWILPSDTHKADYQDHVQSHPILLMQLLYELTGKRIYREAAVKGMAFIEMGQNPNGSWSHHYNRKVGAGESARNYLYGGEINDYTTSDQMTLMLVLYRRTGEVKYLASWLRAVDWLADAFIDGKAKGWAQQYDRNNRPVDARHFEPAAVGMSEGTSSAPWQLIRGWRMTGNPRYREVLETWHRWMMDNRIFLNEEKTRWGWHTYYDYETGEPFGYAHRERTPVSPKSASDRGLNPVLRAIEALDKPDKAGYTPGAEAARALLKRTEGGSFIEGDDIHNRLQTMPLIESFDWSAGSWLFQDDTPNGLKTNPGTVRVSMICWSVYVRRQLKGQIPWDDRMSTLTRDHWASPYNYLVPPNELNKPLSEEELRKARQYIKDHPIVPTTDKLKAGGSQAVTE